jgi:isoamylase
VFFCQARKVLQIGISPLRENDQLARIKEGSAAAHGAIWDGQGTNFTLLSANATKVEVCLFDSHGEKELERIALPEYTDGFWHGYISDVHPAAVYGLRVHGPYEPTAGHRFNPNKLEDEQALVTV